MLWSVTDVYLGQWIGGCIRSFPALGVLAAAPACITGQGGSPYTGRRWWQAAGWPRAATPGTRRRGRGPAVQVDTSSAPSGTCVSSIKGWPHCKQGCQRVPCSSGLGSFISQKQGDLTGFLSNTISGGDHLHHGPSCLQSLAHGPTFPLPLPTTNSASPLPPGPALWHQVLPSRREADLPWTSGPWSLQVPSQASAP